MFQFHQHADGLVFVRENHMQHYGDTVENFEDDFATTLPALPSGFDERIYEPGKRHALHTRDAGLQGGEMPWSYGDNIIKNLSRGITAQQARQAPPPPATADELMAMPEQKRTNLLAPWQLAMEAWKKREADRVARIRSRKK